MKGIEMKFECPACGCILRKEEVLQETPSCYKIARSGISCACGRRGNFELLSFEEREVMIVDSKAQQGQQDAGQ